MTAASQRSVTDVLVVGGGEAGLGIATALRAADYVGAITIVGEEPFRPYQRPPLSKGFMAGVEDDESLELRSPDYYTEQRIDVWSGCRVVGLELNDDGSGSATLDNSSQIEFAMLALTTGSAARQLPVPGSTLDHVYSLRTIEDAVRIRDAVHEDTRLVVIGGGFIGLEIAASARSRGVEVTVVETASRLLERVCAPPLSDYCLTEHRGAGIAVRLDSAVVELLGDERGAVSGVRLADGTTLPATVVIVGVGAVPATDLAEKAGLECRRGILVDTAGRTSHPRVVAAGDCAEQPHPHLDGDSLTIESVNNAIEQSRAAAHALLGMEPPQRGTPWFWSDQGNLKIQIAGISHGSDEHVVRHEPGRLTVLYFRSGRLIAADMVNNPRDFMAVKKALAHGRSVDAGRAGDVAVALRELLKFEA